MTEPTSPSTTGKHVCVIGTGMIGLAATKNLLEQGMLVTTLERNPYLGGLWHPSTDETKTTAMPSTVFITSKQFCHFTDFPFPKESDMHPTAKQVEDYFEAYAEKFDLLRHVQFEREVTKIERDDRRNKWRVHIRDLKAPDSKAIVQDFDRLVLATGSYNTPNNVEFKGIENFEGEAIHSRQFKSPEKYKGKNVVVVGIGGTGADTVTSLNKAGANKIWLSHRRQFYLLPRNLMGKALDHTWNLRLLILARFIAKYVSPFVCAILMSKDMMATSRKAFPELHKTASFDKRRQTDSVIHRVPIFSDELAELLSSGRVKATPGIKEVSGRRSLTMTDGTVLEDVDAIVVCSGFDSDFSLLPEEASPTNPNFASDGYKRMRSARYCETNTESPRLYQGFLSERYPGSLAVLGHLIVVGPPLTLYDLITMALSSVWSGAHPLPGAKEMASDINSHYDYVVKVLDEGVMPHTGFRINSSDTWDWLNRAAGTGVTETFGTFGWRAWKLWWEDRKLYNLVMGGVIEPAVFRLFDLGYGRKAWKGAREEILKTNEEVRLLEQAWKTKQNKR